MEIVNLFYFSVEESLSSSTVVGSLSHYLSSVLIFSITAIGANSNNFSKSTDSLSTVIGLPFHGCQNFRKLGYEIPAPHSPLPAHVLAFPSRHHRLVGGPASASCCQRSLRPLDVGSGWWPPLPLEAS
jgi:hypothetical protein